MATTLDDLFEQQRKTNEATASAWNQYNTAVNAANNSYDTLMRDLDEQDKAAWDTARSQYQGNQRRAQMMHNAQLLGDLAHLGVQTWSTNPSGGSNYVLPSIKPDDKYLQQGEAWRQKMNQSYLDEVAARTKRQREDALNRLNRQVSQAQDDRNFVLRERQQRRLEEAEETKRDKAEAYIGYQRSMAEKNDAMTAYYKAKIDALEAGLSNSQAESYAKAKSYDALARLRDKQAENVGAGYTQEETLTEDNGYGRPTTKKKTVTRTPSKGNQSSRGSLLPSNQQQGGSLLPK